MKIIQYREIAKSGMNLKKNCVLQAFIACIIPNLGAWIFYGILFFKIKENGNIQQIEPSYAPPEWVS